MYALNESWPRNPILRGAAAVWAELPLFLLGGVVIASAWAISRTNPLLLWAAAFAAMPVLAALASMFHKCLAGERARFRRFVKTACSSAPSTWLLFAPAAIGALLTGAAFEIAAASGEGWMLLSGGAGLAVSAVVAAIGGIAVALVLLEGEAPRSAWTHAGAMVLRKPVPAFAAVAAFALAMVATAHLSYALLILVPIPLVCVWVAAFRATRSATP